MDDGNEATRRVIGFDVARSLAMLGMIVVHFSLVAGNPDRAGPAWMTTILSMLDGRASATFVILAGIGLTLMSRRAVSTGDPSAIAAARRTVALRGLFLLIVGFVNLIVWPGDILRVYGVSLLIASLLLTAPGAWLLSLAAAYPVAFIVVMGLADFEKNWDWQTMSYHRLWTPAGALRNLFYDGFRSVLPWTGFVLLGMWLGRLDLTDRRTNRRVLVVGASTFVLAETLSRVLVQYFFSHPPSGMDAETIRALFGTESMPALPLFLLAAGGAATTVIALCVSAAATYPSAQLWKPLAATGQMALTWYALHILVGLGALVALGVVGTKPLPVAAGYGVLFFAATVLLSWAWKKVARHGPLEWVMRKLAG